MPPTLTGSNPSSSIDRYQRLRTLLSPASFSRRRLKVSQLLPHSQSVFLFNPAFRIALHFHVMISLPTLHRRLRLHFRRQCLGGLRFSWLKGLATSKTNHECWNVNLVLLCCYGVFNHRRRDQKRVFAAQTAVRDPEHRA